VAGSRWIGGSRIFVRAYAFKSKVHCKSALGPGASGLPYYCTQLVRVPAVIGAQKRNVFLLKYKLHYCADRRPPVCYFTHRTTYAYLSRPWAVGMTKKNWIRTYSGPVTFNSVEVFRQFSFWRHGTRLTSFLIHLRRCKTSSVGQSAGLSISKLSARFWHVGLFACHIGLFWSIIGLFSYHMGLCV